MKFFPNRLRALFRPAPLGNEPPKIIRPMPAPLPPILPYRIRSGNVKVKETMRRKHPWD